MPWILCGVNPPPLSTWASTGITATILIFAFRFFSTWPTPLTVPPVPTPATTASTLPPLSRQTDSGVPARSLDDRAQSGLDLATFLGIFDHGDRNPVFDRRKRIERLELDHHFRAARCHFAQPHHWRVPDEFRDVVVDFSVLHS